VIGGKRLVSRVRVYVGIAKGVEVLRLAPADWSHRLVRRFALGLVAFFQDRAREVGGILARRG